jgi:hypothetical protein
LCGVFPNNRWLLRDSKLRMGAVLRTYVHISVLDALPVRTLEIQRRSAGENIQNF